MSLNLGATVTFTGLGFGVVFGLVGFGLVGFGLVGLGLVGLGLVGMSGLLAPSVVDAQNPYRLPGHEESLPSVAP